MTRYGSVGLLAIALGGCTGDPGTKEDLPPIGGTDTQTQTQTVVPQVGQFRLSVTPGLDYPVRMRETNTVDTRCEVTPPRDFAQYNELECTLDINELDLYGSGLDFDLSVPANACDYLIYWHYQYEGWEVGLGPPDVSYTVLAGGVITDEVNSINGVPYCKYDYTWGYGDTAPNCCLGDYTKTVNAGGNIITSHEFWDGDPASCYGGAAFIDPEATFGPDGFPRAKIIYLNGAAFQKSFHFEPLSDEFVSNVPLANYYSPQDHDGDRPAGLNGAWAQPRYTFQCVDRDYELFSELRLTVREYNEEAQYDADGNPDTVGFEPVTGHPIDDLNDWAVATPGNAQFIQFLE
ncbi:MAG: hypothetical protein R3F59_35820 [Myxococcota bacterium]